MLWPKCCCSVVVLGLRDGRDRGGEVGMCVVEMKGERDGAGVEKKEAERVRGSDEGREGARKR